MDAILDAENQESLRLLRVAEAERDAVRQHADERERYWHVLSALMIEAGAESGDSEALISSLIRQRDAAREQVRALREALTSLADYSEAHDISPQSLVARRVLADLPATVHRHLA